MAARLEAPKRPPRKADELLRRVLKTPPPYKVSLIFNAYFAEDLAPPLRAPDKTGAGAAEAEGPYFMELRALWLRWDSLLVSKGAESLLVDVEARFGGMAAG